MYTSKWILLLLSVVLSLICPPYHWVIGGNESIIIVVLPQANSEASVSWERREEILPGAIVASKNVNNNSWQDIYLRVLMADSGEITSSDYSYGSRNVINLIANLTFHGRLTDIIGIAGILHPNVLLTLRSFQLPIASLIHFSGIPYSPRMIYMTASTSVVTDSLVALTMKLNEDTIGLITETHHSYYFRVSSQLSTKASVSVYIQVGHQSTKSKFSEISTKLSKANVKVIFVSASRYISLQMLCEAYKIGLTWPKYAWILLSFQLGIQQHITDEECSIQRVLEGVLVLELAQVESEVTHPPLGGNPFAYTLYDAIRMLAVTAVTDNHSSNSQLLDGPLPSIVPRSEVYLYQVFNATLSPSGIYDSEWINYSVNVLSIDQHKHAGVFLLPYLMILPILCSVFNSVLLALFFCFRNEPDVKSTSVSLSLMMFIGCYLFNAYIITVLAGELLHLDLCMIRVSGLSLCVPLVLATALVKMLRVYYVFSIRGYEKPSIFLYNCALFIYTLLIIAPKVCVVILWSSIDLYHREVSRFVDSSGFTIVHTRCRSNYTIIWNLLMAVYDVALSVAVVIVAIKTRKIRFARYKDTKKVNLMVFLVLFVSINTWLHWYIFTASGLYVLVPTYTLYAGSVTLPFICQFTLFLPKIWTPLCNKVHRYLDIRLVFKLGNVVHNNVISHGH